MPPVASPVVRNVASRAAVDKVVALKSFDDLVAVKAKNRIGLAGSEQHVRPGRAVDGKAGGEYEIALLKARHTIQGQCISATEIYNGIATTQRCPGLNIGECKDARHASDVNCVALNTIEVRDDVGPAAISINECVRTTFARQAVITAAPIDRVVATSTIEEFVGAAARDCVVEVRAEDAIYAGEGIVAHRCVAIRSAGRKIDYDAGGGVIELDLCGAVTGDGVVATLALERIETSKARRIVDVGKVAADRAVDAGKGVGTNGGIARC